MTKYYDGQEINFNGSVYTWPPTSGTVGQALIKSSGSSIDWFKAEFLLSRTTGINGSSVATSNLFTVPAGQTLVVTKAIIRLTAATGLTGTLKAGIGIAAGEDDIFASSKLTGLNTIGQVYCFNLLGLSRECAAASVIKLGIDTAFGGTTTLSVDLFGYYL